MTNLPSHITRCDLSTNRWFGLFLQFSGHPYHSYLRAPHSKERQNWLRRPSKAARLDLKDEGLGRGHLHFDCPCAHLCLGLQTAPQRQATLLWRGSLEERRKLRLRCLTSHMLQDRHERTSMLDLARDQLLFRFPVRWLLTLWQPVPSKSPEETG